MGVAVLSGLGIAASVGVLCTVATPLTLLPALLGLLGLRVLSRGQRSALAAGRPDVAQRSGGWLRWSASIARRPVLAAASRWSHSVPVRACVLHAARIRRRRQ